MSTDVLTLTPHLPPGWTGLAFPIHWKGQRIWVELRPEQVSVTNHSPYPLDVRVDQQGKLVPAGGTSVWG